MGRNISPEWIESILLEETLIQQAVVYGDGQKLLGAVIASDAPLDLIYLSIKRANLKLPIYAKIKEFQITPPFSMKTENGKLRRHEIISRYQQEKKHAVL